MRPGWLGWLGALAWSLASAAAVSAQPFRFPEGSYGKGDLHYVNGLPLLRVAGTPEEIGEQVGILGVASARRIVGYPRELLEHIHLGLLWGPLVHSGERMVSHFPADYRAELEATVRSSRVSREAVVAGNTLFDIKKVIACSALLVEPPRSATGGPLLGRNLDYPSLGYMHQYSLVTLYRPCTAKHAFVAVGFPGMVGCLSGMNDAGLALSILEVFQIKVGRKRYDGDGIPYALCYRRLLEECSTIDEAAALLERMDRTTITNLAMADRNGIAVLEVTPRQVVVRRPERGALVCTNHFCSPSLRPYLPLDLFKTYERYETLTHAVNAQEQFGPADLQCSLHCARMGRSTMQTMVFDPAFLRLYLSIGACPSTACQLKVLELGPLFYGATVAFGQ